jgi:hypothetical protein
MVSRSRSALKNVARRSVFGAAMFVFAGCTKGRGDVTAPPTHCQVTAPDEHEPPWHQRVESNCAEVESGAGLRVFSTSERVESFGKDGQRRFASRLEGCEALTGLALAPTGEVAVSCEHNFFLFDSNGRQLIAQRSQLFFSAPLFVNEQVVVARGPHLDARTLQGEQTWSLTLTEHHESPRIPALALSIDGNVLVYLHLAAEQEARKQADGTWRFLTSAEFDPALLVISPEGSVVQEWKRDDPDFTWPQLSAPLP